MAFERRERWTNRTAFIMAAIGSAVGLGNLWRFPAVAFKNGGGAFFIPYFVALISAGIPLMIVEYAIGQKYQGGAPQALAAITSKFRWVGWFALLVGCSITLYYIVVMAYAWHYAVASWSVAWNHPAPVHVVEEQAGTPTVREIPASRVQVYLQAKDAEASVRLAEMQRDRPPEQRLPVWTGEEVARKKAIQQSRPKEERIEYVELGANVANYFQEVCLGGFRPGFWQKAQAHNAGRGSRGPPAEPIPYVRQMFRLSPNLVAGAFVTWLAIFLIIFKGIRNVGRVVMITVPLPVALLVVVLIRGLTLPGSTTGLIYYLTPNWELLKDPGVWMAAYGQIFFSLSLGFGILIAYASYMPPESDVTNSAFITSFGNCATSFLAGLAVFSVLGYLAHLGGEEVGAVVEKGPGLVFVTYPVALAKMPMGRWGIAALSFLFFVCLISLGIDSAFSIVEGVITGFRDRLPRVSRAKMTALFCAVGFVGSLLFCTKGGLMWLDIVDNWMSNYGLALVGLLECIAVGYFFHLDELKDYINAHSEVKVHNWFDAFIKVVTPAILIFLLTNQFLEDIAHAYGGYDKVLRLAVTLAGWGWFLAILCGALLLARHYKAMLGAAFTAVVFLGFLAYLRHMTEPGTFAAGELIAPAAMGAVAAAILFGGLIVCVYIAVKSHHMAGLSMEARSGPGGPFTGEDDTAEETR
ncbi:MAG: SLC5/6 family protein [Planctomycetota bacterium]|jgi:SNF family Na+-dependent transporter